MGKLRESNLDSLPPDIVGIVDNAHHDMEEIRKALVELGSRKRSPWIGLVPAARPVVNVMAPTLPLYFYLIMTPTAIALVIVLVIAALYVYRQHPGVVDELLDAWEDATLKRIKKLGSTIEAHTSMIIRFLAVQTQSKEFNRYDVTKVIFDPKARDFWITQFGADNRRIETHAFIDAYLLCFAPQSNPHNFVRVPIPNSVKEREELKQYDAMIDADVDGDVVEIESKAVVESKTKEEERGWVRCSQCLQLGPNAAAIEAQYPTCPQRLSKDLPKEKRRMLHAALSTVFDDDEDGYVLPSDLNRFLNYFGPIESSYERAVPSLVNLEEGIIYPWFYGSTLGAQDIERRIAEAMDIAARTSSFAAARLAMSAPANSLESKQWDYRGVLPDGAFYVRYSSHENELAVNYCRYDNATNQVIWDKRKIGNDPKKGFYISLGNASASNRSIRYYPNLASLVDDHPEKFKTPFCDPLATVRFNISGRILETQAGIFAPWPETLLAQLITNSKWRSKLSQTPYFFDRDADAFSVILNWYRYGVFHYSQATLSDHLLAKEVVYFKIPGPYPRDLAQAIAALHSLGTSPMPSLEMYLISRTPSVPAILQHQPSVNTSFTSTSALAQVLLRNPSLGSGGGSMSSGNAVAPSFERFGSLSRPALHRESSTGSASGLPNRPPSVTVNALYIPNEDEESPRAMDEQQKDLSTLITAEAIEHLERQETSSDRDKSSSDAAASVSGNDEQGERTELAVLTASEPTSEGVTEPLNENKKPGEPEATITDFASETKHAYAEDHGEDPKPDKEAPKDSAPEPDSGYATLTPATAPEADEDAVAAEGESKDAGLCELGNLHTSAQPLATNEMTLSALKAIAEREGWSMTTPKGTSMYRDWDRATTESRLLDAAQHDDPAKTHLPTRKWFVFRSCSDPEFEVVLSILAGNPVAPKHFKIYYDAQRNTLRLSAKTGREFPTWYDLVRVVLEGSQQEPECVPL